MFNKLKKHFAAHKNPYIAGLVLVLLVTGFFVFKQIDVLDIAGKLTGNVMSGKSDKTKKAPPQEPDGTLTVGTVSKDCKTSGQDIDAQYLITLVSSPTQEAFSTKQKRGHQTFTLKPGVYKVIFSTYNSEYTTPRERQINIVSDIQSNVIGQYITKNDCSKG